MYIKLLAVSLLVCAVYASSSLAAGLPKVPDIIFGVNQYNVGLPQDSAKHWPLTADEASYLKSINCNTIRFPLYPSEVGIDEAALVDWKTGDKFDAKSLGQPDWKSLDALLDWMAVHGFTPFVCPSPEKRGDWSTKTWMSLHVPENAQRTIWFTKLVVDHVTEKYGDQVIYGWYENWYWNSYKHENSAEFKPVFIKKLKTMYKGRIADLNKAWGSRYTSFDEVEIPKLYMNGDISEESINSRRSYDLRQAMDLIQRDVLLDMYKHVKKVAPGAVWSGGCLLNEIGGLNDIRSVGVPRTNATMRTAAVTGDVISADMYGHRFIYYSYYRTISKIAAIEGKKLFIAEVAATKPETFKWVADIGGPSAGVTAWVGKEDSFGFIKGDGSRRTENGEAFSRLYKTFAGNRARYDSYKPGHILVYFPEETLYYSMSARNQMDSYQHICDFMKPEELEPVLTDELEKLPADARLYVLERTLPLKAIKILDRMGDRVVCPHEYFIDENGTKHFRKMPDGDFYSRLMYHPDGTKLLDVFQRVEEKEKNVAYRYYGVTASTPSELAAVNQVIGGRENNINYLIDGSIFEGITFSDKQQNERVYLKLNQSKMVYGAFVQFYEGDGQFVTPSAFPPYISVSVSMDGVNYSEVSRLSASDVKMRPHIRFDPVRAAYVCFDFGDNARGSGLKIEELGVLGNR
ncbi:MAG: hypothetical protein ACYC27_05120 [Armatimonadota bacterium]